DDAGVPQGGGTGGGSGVDDGGALSDAGQSSDSGTPDSGAQDSGLPDAGPVSTPYAFVGSTDGLIRVYRVDLDAGTFFTPPSTTDGGARPSFLAISPDKRSLFACNEANTGTISAFSIGDGGALTFENKVSSGGSGPAHVATDRTGRWVLSSNYTSGDVAVLPVVDGGLGAAVSTDSPGNNAHQMVTDLSNRYAFVPLKGSSKVAQYLFNKTTGAITANAVPALATDAGAGPRHLAFHPNGKWVYLVNENASTVQALFLTGATGELSDMQTLSTLPAGFTGQNTGGEIQVHPNGNFVYVSNRGHDSIAIFSVNQTSGHLTLVGHSPSGGQSPRMFSIDPTGTRMFVGDELTNSIQAFSIDPISGLLSPLGEAAAVPTPQFVEIVFLP
ncbi:MAG: lactonase family protein, partial [Myxococcaceae bacterium]